MVEDGRADCPGVAWALDLALVSDGASLYWGGQPTRGVVPRLPTRQAAVHRGGSRDL
jgi:hypothetical protein